MKAIVCSKISLFMLLFTIVFTISCSGQNHSFEKEKDEQIDYANDFSEVLNYINKYYVDNISVSNLTLGAIHGLVNTLDPHSEFLTAEDYSGFKEHNKGEYVGIGVTIQKINVGQQIVNVNPKGPAKSQGLFVGDIMVKVDGESIAGLSSSEVSKRVMGDKNTYVNITIIRGNSSVPLEFKIKRKVVELPIVEYKMLNNSLGYLSLYQFTSKSYEHFRDALRSLDSDGATGYIIDLRGNPGGLLDEAIDVTSIFLGSEDLIVYTEDKQKKRDNLYANRRGYKTDKPLVVLIDEGSASASEVFAGAIQDHKRGLIIGQTSFGKASVQVALPLSDGSALKLTIARYYTPLGKSIQSVGIKPDINVTAGTINFSESSFLFREGDYNNVLVSSSNGKQEEVKTVVDPKIDEDVQLQTAAQVLQGLIVSRNFK